MDIHGEGDFHVASPADLGSALRYFRRSARVSQTDAASGAGVDQAYISRLEHGRFGPALEHTLRLFSLLGCEVIVRKSSVGKRQQRTGGSNASSGQRTSLGPAGPRRTTTKSSYHQPVSPGPK
jgi:transcriptional regulator with XRE-family HTH domain